MNATFAIDTNCIVAAISTWHEFHGRAVGEIERRLDRGERMVVPVQALLEAYAVLTRMPAPYRLSCPTAWELLKINFIESAEVATLTAAQNVGVLQRAAESGYGGGRIYDSIIASVALSTKSKFLLTFNAKHFEPTPDGVTLIVPC